MRYLVIIPLTLFLAGCNSTQLLTTTKYQVVVPDQSMFQCPVVKKFPDANKLTDVQIAKTLVELYRNNKTCKNSIDAIKKFLEQSKASIEG
jgi:uncharacterized protein YcfL